MTMAEPLFDTLATTLRELMDAHAARIAAFPGDGFPTADARYKRALQAANNLLIKAGIRKRATKDWCKLLEQMGELLMDMLTRKKVGR